MHKACTKPAQKPAQKLKSLIFKGFVVFIVFIVLLCKCIELLRFLLAKIVPWAVLCYNMFLSNGQVCGKNAESLRKDLRKDSSP